MVRAKFRVGLNEPAADGARIILSPVTSGSKENEEFFKWTPWGTIEIGTINPAAAEQFKVGDEFYVDFTKADA